jgi:hypothetical protein
LKCIPIGKIIAGGGQGQIERADVGARRLFEQAEDGFRIAKDVGRSDESTHRPLDAQHRHLGAQRGGSALGIGKLMAGANRAERNVMRHDQADGRFDLVHARSQQGTEHDR